MKYILLFVLLLCFGCSEGSNQPKRLRMPDRLTYFSTEWLDDGPGMISRREYEIYIDMKTGQKYVFIDYGHSGMMFPLLESKELIDADLAEFLESAAKEGR